MSNFRASNLPINYGLRLITLSSLAIALLTAVASIASLVYQDDIYPTEALRTSFLANDVVNLFIGLPILLLSMGLAGRGKVVGLLFWPGALFYGLYNYLAYLFGMPFNGMFPFYLAIVTLSIYTTIGLVAGIDGQALKNRLAGRVPEKLAGGVLTAFGILFMLLATSEMITPLINQMPIARPDLGLAVADVILSAALAIGGVLLWQRQALGYVGGTGLLFLATMLFMGLIFVLLLQPFLTPTPLALTDVVVILLMSLVSIVPLALFMRGVVKG
jgi:hypothetical protein